MGSDPKSVDQVFRAGDITTGSSERFRECSHEDIDFSWVYTEIVAYTSSVGSDRTDRVCFIDIQVKLISALTQK